MGDVLSAWFNAVPRVAEVSAECGKAPRLPDRPLMTVVGSTAAGKVQTSPRKLRPFLVRPRGPDLIPHLKARLLLSWPQTVGSVLLSPLL